MTPVYRIVYEGRDITAEIQDAVTGVTYTDAVDGMADTFEFDVMDTDGKWRGPWFPSAGAKIQAAIGYAPTPLPIGVFEVDTVQVSAPPWKMSVLAVSAPPSKALRTKRTRGFEGTTLPELVRRVIGRQPIGEILPVRMERVTQNNETDLAFLARVCRMYGHFFSVRGDAVTVYQYEALYGSAPVATITPGEVTDVALRKTILGTVKRARVVYDAPDLAGPLADLAELVGEGLADEEWIEQRVENETQARRMAQSAMVKSKANGQAGTLTMPGNPALTAGQTVALEGFGALSGKYLVKSSRHSIQPGAGYSTEIEIEYA
jgi:phage protein D